MLTTRLGDFTGLAKNYALFRAGYSQSVQRAIVGCQIEVGQSDFVDVGAGTGIWTRQMANLNFRSVRAVEPNDDMREQGMSANDSLKIAWSKGSAEETGLESASCDLVSMASSFHWADFDLASREFCRILRPGGRFVALWNPRLIEVNPLLVEIEQELQRLRPEMKRVSSGRSDFTSSLTERLNSSPFWKDVIYVEGRHIELQSRERYLGLWRSVNDVRAQLGEEKFHQFMNFVEAKTAHLSEIEATYETRAWVAHKAEG